jgi:hypothetical protein
VSSVTSTRSPARRRWSRTAADSVSVVVSLASSLFRPCYPNSPIMGIEVAVMAYRSNPSLRMAERGLYGSQQPPWREQCPANTSKRTVLPAPGAGLQPDRWTGRFARNWLKGCDACPSRLLAREGFRRHSSRLAGRADDGVGLTILSNSLELPPRTGHTGLRRRVMTYLVLARNLPMSSLRPAPNGGSLP